MLFRSVKILFFYLTTGQRTREPNGTGLPNLWDPFLIQQFPIFALPGNSVEAASRSVSNFALTTVAILCFKDIAPVFAAPAFGEETTEEMSRAGAAIITNFYEQPLD